MGLHWNGGEIAAQVLAASVEAIDEVTAEAAEDAKGAHAWRNRSGRLEHEIISEPARPVEHGAAGRFGTTRKRGFYGLFLEYKEPFLRPAADRVFPTLAAKIREKL